MFAHVKYYPGLDAGVPRLPALLGAANGLEERQQRGDAKRRRHDGEGARRGVTHVLVEVVDVGTHLLGGAHAASRSAIDDPRETLIPVRVT